MIPKLQKHRTGSRYVILSVGLSLFLSIMGLSADSFVAKPPDGFLYSTYSPVAERGTVNIGSFTVSSGGDAHRRIYKNFVGDGRRVLANAVHGGGKDFALQWLRDGEVDWSAWRGRHIDGAVADLNAALNAELSQHSLSAMRTVEFDLSSRVGRSPGYAGVSALGSLRDSADDAVVWQLRGYAGKENRHGANVGLIYRRVMGDEWLLGVNSFIDYERKDSADFWRWSVGGEARTAWVSMLVNYYEGLSDAVTRTDAAGRRRTSYTASGYDAALHVHAPSQRWLSVGLEHYFWRGEYGRADDSGLRVRLKLAPRSFPFAGELVYEKGDEGEGIGGRISFFHRLGETVKGGGLPSSPRLHDWFYTPVARDYTQRIYEVDDSAASSIYSINDIMAPAGVAAVEIGGTDTTLTLTPVTASSFVLSGDLSGEPVRAGTTMTVPWRIPVTPATLETVGGSAVSLHYARGAQSSEIQVGSTVVLDGTRFYLIDGTLRIESDPGFQARIPALTAAVTILTRSAFHLSYAGGDNADLILRTGNLDGFDCNAANALIGGINFQRRCDPQPPLVSLNADYPNNDFITPTLVSNRIVLSFLGSLPTSDPVAFFRPRGGTEDAILAADNSPLMLLFDAQSGALRLASNFDSQFNSSVTVVTHVFRVQTEDGEFPEASAAAEFTVQFVRRPLPLSLFMSDAPVSITTEISANEAVATATAIGGALPYRYALQAVGGGDLGGAAAGRLSIDPNSGVIHLGDAFETVEEFSLEAVVMDKDGTKATARLDFEVNLLSLELSLSALTVSFQTQISANEAAATATARGGTGPYRYALQAVGGGDLRGAAAGRLSIDPTSGVIRLGDDVFNAAEEFSLEAVVTDSTGTTATARLDVEIVRSALELSVGDSVRVQAQVSANEAVATATASGGVLPYHYALQAVGGGDLGGAAAGRLSIDPTGGVIRLGDAFEVAEEFSVQVLVTDGDGETTTERLDFEVSPPPLGLSVKDSVTRIRARVSANEALATATASGGALPYRYSLQSVGGGNLPAAVAARLSIGPTDGVINLGNAFEAAEDIDVEVLVTDDDGETMTALWQLRIALPLAVQTSADADRVGDGGASDPYRYVIGVSLPADSLFQLDVMGGFGAYTYHADESGLVRIDADGRVFLDDNARFSSMGGHAIVLSVSDVADTANSATITVHLRVVDELELSVRDSVTHIRAQVSENEVLATATALGGALPYHYTLQSVGGGDLPAAVAARLSIGPTDGIIRLGDAFAAVEDIDVEVLVADDDGETMTALWQLRIALPLAVQISADADRVGDGGASEPYRYVIGVSSLADSLFQLNVMGGFGAYTYHADESGLVRIDADGRVFPDDNARFSSMGGHAVTLSVSDVADTANSATLIVHSRVVEQLSGSIASELPRNGDDILVMESDVALDNDRGGVLANIIANGGDGGVADVAGTYNYVVQDNNAFTANADGEIRFVGALANAFRVTVSVEISDDSGAPAIFAAATLSISARSPEIIVEAAANVAGRYEQTGVSFPPGTVYGIQKTYRDILDFLDPVTGDAPIQLSVPLYEELGVPYTIEKVESGSSPEMTVISPGGSGTARAVFIEDKFIIGNAAASANVPRRCHRLVVEAVPQAGATDRPPAPKVTLYFYTFSKFPKASVACPAAASPLQVGVQAVAAGDGTELSPYPAGADYRVASYRATGGQLAAGRSSYYIAELEGGGGNLELVNGAREDNNVLRTFHLQTSDSPTPGAYTVTVRISDRQTFTPASSSTVVVNIVDPATLSPLVAGVASTLNGDGLTKNTALEATSLDDLDDPLLSLSASGGAGDPVYTRRGGDGLLLVDGDGVVRYNLAATRPTPVRFCPFPATNGCTCLRDGCFVPAAEPEPSLATLSLVVEISDGVFALPVVTTVFVVTDFRLTVSLSDNSSPPQRNEGYVFTPAAGDESNPHQVEIPLSSGGFQRILTATGRGGAGDYGYRFESDTGALFLRGRLDGRLSIDADGRISFQNISIANEFTETVRLVVTDGDGATVTLHFALRFYNSP